MVIFLPLIKQILALVSEKTITILGCGWLGKIVGKHLIDQGFTVLGSYRSDASMHALTDIGIVPFFADFNNSTELPNAALQSTHVLIFLPPSACNDKSEYPKLLTAFTNQFPETTHFIFSSSTGVYPKSGGTYTESSEIPNDPENYLLAAEKVLLKQAKDRVTILRLGGLIGPGRHPIQSLQGRAPSLSGSTSINLIHALDIAEAVILFIQHVPKVQLFNMVYPEHPSRKEYYSMAADFFNLEAPQFSVHEAPNRIVSGDFIEQSTAFNYCISVYDFDVI